MKKFIAHILVFSLFSLVIFGTGFPHLVHADQPPPGALTGNGTSVAGAVAGAAGGLLNIAFTPIVNQISVILLTVTSWITMLGGMILNFAVNYTVVNMAQHFSTSGGGIGTAINNTWVAVRDLANMSFIFVLLYAAIMTMFGKGDYKKTVVNMVIAAILINFSLFFTKVIIDAANLLTMLFYNAAAPGALADTSFWQTGLSNSITNILGFSTIFKLNGSISAGSLLITGVMGSLVLLICGFIFFAVAIMFVIRYVVLVLVMILSPIMFVGMILPGLGGYTKQWWSALSSQAFFAPIFMLLMWVSITVMNNMGLATDYNAAFTGSTASVVNGVAATGVSPTMASTFINFAIVIVFIIASLLISKKYSERAGGFVNTLTKSALGYAGGATIGVAGRFARGTVGRAAQNIADDEKLKDRAARGDISARLALATSRKLASSSFDLRGTGLNKQLGAGKAQSGGFAGDLKNKIKNEKEYADAFKPADTALYEAEQNQLAIEKGTASSKLLEKLDGERKADAERLLKQTETLEKNRVKYAAGGASFTELQELDKQIALSKKDQQATSGRESYVRMKVDQIKGVDDKEARKRAAKDITGGDENKLNELIKNKNAEALAAVEGHTRSNIAVARKTTYARYLEEGRSLGARFSVMRRIIGGGPVKKEYIAAAVAIRKDMQKKSAKDNLAEAAAALVKENADTDTAAGTPPATPPAGGTPPPATP